ncbi:MAG: proteasome subunit beta [archaeon]
MDAELKKSILKTGTTILGIVCKDGVVMASDRQVTLGHSLVADKKFQKINPINDYILVGWAGQVSGAQRISKILPAELKIKELKTRTRPSVRQAASLLSNIAYSGIRQASMVPDIVETFLGGFNEDGSCELYEISPDGALLPIRDYGSTGSGMTFVLGLLERQYKKGLTVKEGVELAKEALKSSTQRDIGSGYGIDVFTITKDGIKKVVEQTIEPDYKDDKKE